VVCVVQRDDRCQPRSVVALGTAGPVLTEGVPEVQERGDSGVVVSDL
jgi:hypothetical protein